MKSNLIVLLLVLTLGAFAQSKKAYEYTVDLTTVVDDKVKVELIAPPISEEEVTFYMPKIIPGTYAIEDYGRFVHDFKAVDKKGHALKVTKTDTNSWKIEGARKLAKVTYWIEDSFDTKLEGPSIFQPAGTNIEEGKNFILNPSGFFGYFENLKQTPFKFNIVRNKDFYGSTGLIAEKTNEPISSVRLEKKPLPDNRVDVFVAENYDRLADSPLMYAKADTAVIKVSNTEVLIGSYSPNGKISAAEIANSVREILMAQKEYLGGKLPVEKYAFILYFTDQPVNSYGALEHSYSSFYFLPEAGIGQLKQTLRDVAAHEFFHIVTPLNIHSEEIHEFDFNDPRMSEHLWLYEGVTEYFAGNMQVKYGLITPDQYLAILRQKLLISDGFRDDLPFTEFSKEVLSTYGDQYYNVYQKGALIGMCLDIQLRKLSGGTYGVQTLVADLAKKYGKQRAFKDVELFSEIGKLTYPEIEDFLRKCVGGPESLPLQSIFTAVGVNYNKDHFETEYSLGFDNSNIAVVEHNDKSMLSIKNSDKMNEQGIAFGFKDGDILFKINEEEVPAVGPDLSPFIARYKENLKDVGELTYTVLRKADGDDYKEEKLTALVKQVKVSKRHVLSFDEDASEEQLALRKSWLTPQ